MSRKARSRDRAPEILLVVGEKSDVGAAHARALAAIPLVPETVRPGEPIGGALARTAALAALVVAPDGEPERAIETCETIRREAAGRDVPIILAASARDLDLCLARSPVIASDLLRKPFSARELSFRVSRQLAERGMRSSLAGMRARAEQQGEAIEERTATLERQIRFTGQIIDSLPLSLYVVDRDRTIVAWNRQRETGSQGLLREKALGRSLFEVFDHQDRGAIEAELGPVFERGDSLLFERETAVGDDLRHYRIRKLPMRLEPGEVTHVLTIGEDITEQRGIEKSMMVAEKMAALGRVAAGVAHEINNPLAAIVTCAEGLGSRLRDLGVSAGAAVEFHEYLRIVEQEAYRAKRITEELLDFSRARKSPARPQSLEELLDRTLLIVKHSRGFQNVEVERIFEDDLPEVQVEEDAMVQALLNLILNAIDAMPGGGRLKLTTRRAGETVRCEVRDTGCGIARTDLPKIFEPFFTTKPPGRGTGLGLWLCYRTVRSHGGAIEVDSKTGQGSRFTVILPAAGTARAEAPEERRCSQLIPSAC